MIKTQKSALNDFASSRTRKYYLGTVEGKKDMADLAATEIALINANYNESIEAHTGARYDQTEYSVIGNVDKLWKASIVYPSAKDLSRRSHMLKKFNIDVNDATIKIRDRDGNETEYVGKILTPMEMELIYDKFNADQKDSKMLKVSPLNGSKGVEFYAFKGFVSDGSIMQGNATGTVDEEVSVIFNYENPLSVTAVIDEINSKAVELWLLSNASVE
jgi:hypothetical protein